MVESRYTPKYEIRIMKLGFCGFAVGIEAEYGTEEAELRSVIARSSYCVYWHITRDINSIQLCSRTEV